MKTFIKKIWNNASSQMLLKLIVLGSIAFVCYYFFFAINLDTPIDIELKSSVKQLRDEYKKLSAYNDELEDVLVNTEKRDSNIYKLIYGKYPENHIASSDYRNIKNLNELSNIELMNLLKQKVNSLDDSLTNTDLSYKDLLMDLKKNWLRNYIPSIQPVNNSDFSISITPIGNRIEPFYKEPFFHKGIDYLIPEETRVFATANGTVRSITSANSKQGITIAIDHLNRYYTYYSHLNKSTVRRGQKVKMGEIIGYSGNTGISFMPHLHYEVKYRNRHLDPIDFFFRELNAHDIAELKRLSQKNVQALD